MLESLVGTKNKTAVFVSRVLNVGGVVAQEKTKSTVTSASPTDKVRSATGCWRGEPNLWPARTNSSLKQQGTKQSSGFDSAHPSHSFFETPHANSQLDVFPSHPTLLQPCKDGRHFRNTATVGNKGSSTRTTKFFAFVDTKGLMPSGSSRNQ